MELNTSLEQTSDMLSFEGFRKAVLEDYRFAVISRDCTLFGG